MVERIGPKWLEIDLAGFSRNVLAIRERVAPAGVIPVLKANAYGHGMIELARRLERDGAELIAVATLDEAVRLRENFFRGRILLLGAAPVSEIPDILNNRVTPTICEEDFAESLSSWACRLGQTISSHLYVDTGMGRMGHPLPRAAAVYDSAASLPGIRIEAVYSHFPVSDEPDEDSKSFTRGQWEKLSRWASGLPHKPMVHMANSGALLQHGYSHGGAVRPGLLCYGISPCPGLRPFDPVRPILSIKCRPLFIKEMEAGGCVGYGREFRLAKKSRIMTLPVGYADGIPRRLAQSLKVGVRGGLYPVVGRICMDMMMVDLGESAEVSLEDEVVLLGKGGQDIYEWAKATGTIPYELLTGLGPRWDRLYVDSEDGSERLSSRMAERGN